MALQGPTEEILKEALRSRHKESFERSLGRTVRNHGGTYADYLGLISQVRERARADKIDFPEAARRIASHP